VLKERQSEAAIGCGQTSCEVAVRPATWGNMTRKKNKSQGKEEGEKKKPKAADGPEETRISQEGNHKKERWLQGHLCQGNSG